MSTNDSNITKPTLETVLERINSLDERLNGKIDNLEERLNNRINSLEERMKGKFEDVHVKLDELDLRFDRIESAAYASRAVSMELRADFRELNKRLQQHFPALP